MNSIFSDAYQENAVKICCTAFAEMFFVPKFPRNNSCLKECENFTRIIEKNLATMPWFSLHKNSCCKNFVFVGLCCTEFIAEKMSHKNCAKKIARNLLKKISAKFVARKFERTLAEKVARNFCKKSTQKNCRRKEKRRCEIALQKCRTFFAQKIRHKKSPHFFRSATEFCSS